MHEQPRSACRFSAPGSGADAGCRDDSNRRGRLWPDKFYWSRRAAHGAQDRRRASPLADARFGLTGALLLVIADLLARIIHPPLELPAGVLTAIIGAPWFVWLLVRMR